ncbi:class I SAM-dependent methyltransferase [Nocardia cerradoensis]|uniref:Putative methyltransferase n=1 Tax=Nocardia cerradoensis TaxID=85688 RepID=A0A231H9P0_9NOCA|nr:methyltransferase domain-containing protein [Nocardia cerradoensis]NKY42559.1 class I SAM-dependent methyltransferase [Nocardia cerradoensis]OXR45575.1 putative methyltransferase [Nocardia cerradoensis]
MPDPLHFDIHAEVYDRARPPYPAVLWAELQDLGVLRPGIRAIDLGAGSGLATGPLLETGASVDAVEPGRALADRLRRRWPAAVVHVDTVEHVELPTNFYDLAVAATAVHWFDLEVVMPKLHHALRPRGHFAVWRNAFGDPTVSITPFRERVAHIVARRETAEPRRVYGELDTQAWAARLTASEHFETRHIRHFPWSIDMRTDQIHDLFTTFSNWTPAEVDEAARAVDELGGQVTEHYVTPLIVLRSNEFAPD